ncbi:hypothetical protein NKH18_03655 [Streptomyces sp. M10(2022)]
MQWYATAEALAAYDSRYTTGWTTLICAVAAQSLLCCTARAAVYRMRARSAARHPQSVLVVGDGPVAQQVTAVLQQHPEYGMQPVGRVHRTPRRPPDRASPRRCPSWPRPRTSAGRSSRTAFGTPSSPSRRKRRPAGLRCSGSSAARLPGVADQRPGRYHRAPPGRQT